MAMKMKVKGGSRDILTEALYSLYGAFGLERVTANQGKCDMLRYAIKKTERLEREIKEDGKNKR